MYLVLLAILYIIYLSVGISDSLLGSAWPGMYGQLQVPVSYVGMISMIIAGGTVLSNLASYKILKRFGTRRTIFVSLLLTSAALFGFSSSSSFPVLCICAIPYGLGTGAISAALIKFVALNYKLQHMNWLHCSWGIGGTIGPSVVGFLLTQGYNWQRSYLTIALFFLPVILLIFLSASLWKRDVTANQEETAHKNIKIREALQMTGVKQILAAFFAYSSLEAVTGLWASSYLTIGRGMSVQKAAAGTSLFFLGITIGRFVSGVFSVKAENKSLVRIGQGFILAGIFLLLWAGSNQMALLSLVLVGLGCAPIYPCLLHAAPGYFGKESAQSIMGIQMASAYIGSIFMPPLFGLAAEYVSISLYPLFLLFLLILQVITVEFANRMLRRSPI